MQLSIRASQIDLTGALEEFVKIKSESIAKMVSGLEKDGERILYVELARSTKHHHKGNVFYAELSLGLLGKNLRVEYYDKDVRSAIDQAKDKMKIEIRKIKDKKESAVRKERQSQE